jgi:hypothetical protein
VILVLIVCGVLGYGYWHAATHASFHINLHLLTAQGARPQAMPKAEITFRDESGKMLAQGVSDESANFVHLLHPEAGDCHDVEKMAATSSTVRTAWQECFAQQAAWIPTWARHLREVDVQYNGRRFEKIPVTVSEYNSEWFLWWVPLPHVGGKPYTYFRTTITVKAGHISR